MNIEEKIGDSIHIRAVRYGAEHPNGFSYSNIQNHYSRRAEEWEVVKVFLLAAKRNKESGLNITTPFQVLRNRGSADEDTDFILSYEAAFNYLDFQELKQAINNAKSASLTAVIAIGISVASMVFSIYYSQMQINSQTVIDYDQFQQLIQAIPTDKESVKIDEKQLDSALKVLTPKPAPQK
jgi:hypothetical protein